MAEKKRDVKFTIDLSELISSKLSELTDKYEKIEIVLEDAIIEAEKLSFLISPSILKQLARGGESK